MREALRVPGMLFLACLLLGGCKTSELISASRLRSARIERYQPPFDALAIQPGDKLQIILHRSETSDSFIEVVDDAGCVTLPYIGQVKVSGESGAVAEDIIRSEYIGKRIYKEGSIQVAVVPPVKEFYVQGQVHRPGAYQFERNLYVLQAVVKAGGRTEFADPRIIKLNRNNTVYLIDARKVKEGKEQDRPVEPGDIIDVPRGWM